MRRLTISLDFFGNNTYVSLCVLRPDRLKNIALVAVQWKNGMNYFPPAHGQTLAARPNSRSFDVLPVGRYRGYSVNRRRGSYRHNIVTQHYDICPRRVWTRHHSTRYRNLFHANKRNPCVIVIRYIIIFN